MSKVVQRRTRRSSAQWQEILDRFHGSGSTAVDYCHLQGVNPTCFDRWRRKLSGRKADRVVMPSFVELPATSFAPASRWQIELDLGDGVVLRLAR